jgi:small subunit ribosomal protein S4
MARTNKDAKCKLCRREGAKLYLKGTKCVTHCTLDKKSTPPGPHMSRGRMSNYGKQFREKQKVKRIYGLLEAPFRRIFEMAKKDKMQTGTKLLQLLERRLDNVMHRMGFTHSRNQARQLIRHGHVFVNGKKLDIPSYIVEIGDEIELKKERISDNLISEMQLQTKDLKKAEWVEVQAYGKGKVAQYPERSMMDQSISEQLIVEYYSTR